VKRKEYFWLYFGVREGDFGAEPDAVEISSMLDSGEEADIDILGCPSISCKTWVEI